MNIYITSWWSLLLINRPCEDERLEGSNWGELVMCIAQLHFCIYIFCICISSWYSTDISFNFAIIICSWKGNPRSDVTLPCVTDLVVHLHVQWLRRGRWTFHLCSSGVRHVFLYQILSLWYLSQILISLCQENRSWRDMYVLITAAQW